MSGKKQFYIFRRDTGPISDKARAQEIEKIAQGIKRYFPGVTVETTLFGVTIYIPEKFADEWAREIEQQFSCKVMDASKMR